MQTLVQLTTPTNGILHSKSTSNGRVLHRIEKQGVKLYLPFDKPDGGLELDYSSYDSHGTRYGASRVEGKIGKALYFDTVDDYVEVPYSLNLDLTNNIELKCHVKKSDTRIGISTVEELQNMKNDLAANYYLMNDISCSGTVSWNGGAGFEPIGNSSNYFTGNFDGRNYKLIGLYINRPTEDYVGLFGRSEASGSRIQNLEMEDSVVSGKSYVGGLIGRTKYTYCENIKMINVNVTGGSLYGGTYVGGIVGIAGSMHVKKSSVTGSVTGTTYVGGVIGGYIGGYRVSFSLYDCYATCSVTGNTSVGGLVGQFKGHSRSKSKCYRSYSTGLVTFITSGGGLFGSCSSSSCYNSFWDTQTSNQATSCLGIGKTTAEMKQQATYTADPTYPWDFVDVWDITENVTYPFLRPIIPDSGTIKPLICKSNDTYALKVDDYYVRGYINNTEILGNAGGWENVYYTIGLVYDGNTLKVMRDDITLNEITLSGTIQTNTNSIVIGAQAGLSIDEVMIYGE